MMMLKTGLNSWVNPGISHGRGIEAIFKNLSFVCCFQASVTKQQIVLELWEKDLPRVIFADISSKFCCFLELFLDIRIQYLIFRSCCSFVTTLFQALYFQSNGLQWPLSVALIMTKKKEKVVSFCFPPLLWRLHNDKRSFQLPQLKKRRKKNSHSLPASVPCTVLRLTPGAACYLRWLAMPELLRLPLGQVA